MTSRLRGPPLLAVVLLAAAGPAAASGPSSYLVGSLPVAPLVGSIEFPVATGFAAELGLGAMWQGTYDEGNPFTYLALVSPIAWLHYDGVPNLRLSAAFQEAFYREVPPLGIEPSHEERGVVRARLQQPRGAAALYEMLQLDVRSFDDASGTHRLVLRPRFRLGQGFNLDAVRIHSLVLYQEVAFRFSEEGYAERPFEFFRAFAGYTWTTRRGTFATLGVVAQISLNPGATRYDVLWGPVLALNHRFRAAAPETPPAPADVDVQ
jgi:hypothetical protein